MDVQMPVMDGLEATAIIRKEISEKIPVIALTAYAIKGDDKKFLAAGMNDYLSKPFQENQLLGMVTRWIKGKEHRKPIPTPSDGISESLYDLSKIESIAQGNPGFVDQMVALFIDQSLKTIDEIKEAYKEKDFEKVSKLAHRLKPSIDNMGVVSLQKEIREMEGSAEAYGATEPLKSLIDLLDERLTGVVNELKKRKSNNTK